MLLVRLLAASMGVFLSLLSMHAQVSLISSHALGLLKLPASFFLNTPCDQSTRGDPLVQLEDTDTTLFNSEESLLPRHGHAIMTHRPLLTPLDTIKDLPLPCEVCGVDDDPWRTQSQTAEPALTDLSFVPYSTIVQLEPIRTDASSSLPWPSTTSTTTAHLHKVVGAACILAVLSCVALVAVNTPSSEAEVGNTISIIVLCI